ncbi:MAG: ABC transporter ATP-binding protein [Sphaerochaetaceae bacterium]
MAQVEVPRLGGAKVGGPARFNPTEKAKNPKGTLRRIVLLLMRYKNMAIISILLTILSSVIAVAIPYYVGKTFNTLGINDHSVDTPHLMLLLEIIITLYVADWTLSTISSVTILKLSQKMVYALRRDFFAKMQKLPLSFYDGHSRGDTMSRITNDVDTISQTIAQSATQLVSSFLTIVGSLVVMFSLSLPLTFSVLVSVPLVLFLTRIIAKKSRKNFLDQQRNLGQLNGIIEESIQGLKMVKAFSKEQDTLSNFEVINQKLCTSGTKAQTWAGYMMPLMNVINNLTFTIVAIVSGVLCTRYGLLIGTAVTFLSYSKHFATPLNSVAGLFNSIQSALAGAERVFQILDEQEEQADGKTAKELGQRQGAVEFKNVGFSYDKGKPVLKDISFKVQNGEHIALVGETGSGKTTIVNLLTRFYEMDEGSITLGGIDIRDIKRKELQSHYSVVLQETCLFSGTIADNIRYGNPNATDSEVMRAAKISHADEFIVKLPNGYESQLSGSADSLSEGQRQLLAIARAVLCDCPILILDEATSSVDTKTEKDIQQALLHLMKNRTSFIIAHRLSTIRDASRILVIDQGKIAEQGSHKQLMALRGRYYQMVMSQTGLTIGAQS